MQSSQASSACEQLRVFRAAHHVRTHVVAEHAWDVIECGTGPNTVALLPGGGGSAESQFQLISDLEPHARVLAFGCPAGVRTIRGVVDGLERLVGDYEVDASFFVGHSLGGIFAEAFAATHGDRVKGLILANVAHYGPVRARAIPAILGAARYMPERMVVSLLTARVNRLLHGHPDRLFWLDYFTRDELQRVGSEGIANRGSCIADAIAHWSADAAHTKYDGPVLILEADNETGFTPAEREKFRGLYPQAEVRILYGAGHLASITCRDEFVTEVLGFMERSQLPAPR